MIEVLAYFLIAITGVSFGLVGAGGAILVVPILTYLLAVNAKDATAFSLPISVLVSGVGAFMGIRSKQVDLNMVLSFGLPTAVFAFASRKFLVPMLPPQIYGFSRDSALMLGFSIILLTAGVLMVRGGKYERSRFPHRWEGVALGVAVGTFAGFFGIGGGFLIVPILVMVYGMDMKSAVPTSLACVTVITGFAFCAAYLNQPNMPWRFLGGLMAVAAAGMVVGTLLRNKIDGSKLKAGFGILVLVVGLTVVGIEAAKLWLPGVDGG